MERRNVWVVVHESKNESEVQTEVEVYSDRASADKAVEAAVSLEITERRLTDEDEIRETIKRTNDCVKFLCANGEWDYRIKVMKREEMVPEKPFAELTDSELLTVFGKRVIEYDRLRDTEIEFYTEHPNRDLWDEEMVKNHSELLVDITKAFDRVRECLARACPDEFPF